MTSTVSAVRVAARALLLAASAVAMSCSHGSDTAEDTKQGWARAYIRVIVEALTRFHADTGRWPTTQEGLEVLVIDEKNIVGWNGPYINRAKVPIDRWGRPFLYRSPAAAKARPYELYSMGPNGLDDGGGGDDITADMASNMPK